MVQQKRQPREEYAHESQSQRFTAAITGSYDDTGAIERLCDEISDQLEGETPDLLVVFAGAPGHFEFPEILPTLHQRLTPSMVVGCSGSGIIGNSIEFEHGSGLSVLAAKCEPGSVYPFSFNDKEACGKEATPETLLRVIDAEPSEFEGGSMLVFVDPLTVSTEYSLSMLDSAYPRIRKFGALVSGGMEYGDNGMFMGEELKRQGAVGLLFKSDFNADTIVSGSETPIGSPMTITSSNRNVIHRVDDRTPLEALEEIHRKSDDVRRKLITQTLVAGIENDRMSYPTTGMYDFVMRNIMDIDDVTGAMAIGDLVEEGQAFQFHVRDPERAETELRMNLEDYVVKCVDGDQRPQAALCFNSVTRGTRMYEEEHHDSAIIADHVGETPLSGFFSNGEIVSRLGGFLGDEYMSKVMGYTNTLVVLRSAMKRPSRKESKLSAADVKIDRHGLGGSGVTRASSTASRARRGGQHSEENG